MSVPTFVVGTGRCGSTMLSNMLRDHPHVLSISEFFSYVSDGGLRIPEAFSPEPVEGRAFWAFIAGITPLVSFAVEHGLTGPEALYPFDSSPTRYSSETGVPAILITMLPHLTDNHEALFDLLGGEVSKWPNATIGEHYRHLFGWLADRFGKRLWVERSGGGLGMCEQLLATFPDARFIHIVRDGRDAALSMYRFEGFRMAIVMSSLGEYLGVHPITSPDRTNIDRVPAELQPFLPENFDVEAFRALPTPLPLCGAHWTQQIERGIHVLDALPTDRLLTLRYEDFFAEPKKQVDALAGFLGDDFVDEAWSSRCAATVRKPRSSWRDLPAADSGALTAACQPGLEQLRAAGVHYDL